MSITSSPIISSQPFLNKQEYKGLKNNLGNMIFCGVQIWINQASYCEETKKGTKDLTSKNIYKRDILFDNKNKKKLSVDFYCDKLISINVPEDIKDILESLTKTEKAAHEVLLGICVKLFDAPEVSEFKDVIKKAEDIKSLKDSSLIKTAAYTVLQENVWDIQSRSHLCEDRFLKNWV